MGVALVMIVLYAMNKIVAISDAFVGDKKQAAGGRALSSQVSDKINAFLQNSDISNHVA